MYDGQVLYDKSRGDRWSSFYYDVASRTSMVKGNTQLPITIYLSAGSDSHPTEFDYDLIFSNVFGDFKLSADDMPQYMSNGYAISIYIEGTVDFENDFAIQNTLQISFTA